MKKPSKTELRKLSKQKTLSEIAATLSVHRTTVSKWKKSYGLLGIVKEKKVTEHSLRIKEAIDNGELKGFWEKGLNFHQIARSLGTSHTTLRKYLRKNGVERPIQLRLNTSESKNYDGNLSVNSKYYVNENFFEIIDTEEKAYVLGFWAADGWMAKRALFIATSEEDLDFLEKIKNIIPTEAPIITKIKKSDFKRKKLAILSLARKKMYIDVQKLGYTDKKTENMIFPDIPKKLHKHFIRGFWDGDGYIGERQFSVVGKNVVFFQTLQQIIFKSTGVNLTFDMVRDSYPRLSGGKKHKSALQWIYSDCTIYLDRKHKKYRQYWNDI